MTITQDFSLKLNFALFNSGVSKENVSITDPPELTAGGVTGQSTVLVRKPAVEESSAGREIATTQRTYSAYYHGILVLLGLENIVTVVSLLSTELYFLL